MPKIRVELGKRAYLFKNADGYAPSVIISAHGFYTDASGMYTPGHRTLQFYCKHDQTADIVAPRIIADQQVPLGNVTACRDYTLFKLQEHKSAIKQHANKKHLTFAEAESWMGSLYGETYATFTESTDDDNDFVTIRNRHNAFGGPLITLSALITLIEQTHPYGTYKCKFCREHKGHGYAPDLNADR